MIDQNLTLRTTESSQSGGMRSNGASDEPDDLEEQAEKNGLMQQQQQPPARATTVKDTSMLDSLIRFLSPLFSWCWVFFLKLLGFQDLEAIKCLPKRQDTSDAEKKRIILMERLEAEGLSPSVPLVDIHFSEDDILLPNIQHVKRGAIDPVDGLEEVIPLDDDKHVWPFSSCDTSGWVFDKQLRVYRYCKEYSDLFVPQETEIHKCFVQARMRMARGDTDAAVAWFSRIVQIAPENDKDFLIQSATFTSLGELLSSNSKVASQHRFMKNDCTAALLFKVGAVVFKNPYAIYFYGLALNNGQGGVKKCRSKSIQLLNAAGAQRIGEAYYALGSISEATATSNPENTKIEFISQATRFYSAASQAYTFKYPVSGKSDDETRTRVSHVPPPGACCTPWMSSIPSLPLTEGWQSSQLADALSLRLFWGLAAQAFLFSAAASLVSSTYIGATYQVLAPVIPSLGIILALHGLFRVTEVIVRARKPWDQVRLMANEKINAYSCILEASVNDPHYPERKRATAWEKQRVYLRKQSFKVSFLKFLATWDARTNWALQMMFLLSWILLMDSWRSAGIPDAPPGGGYKLETNDTVVDPVQNQTALSDVVN